MRLHDAPVPLASTLLLSALLLGACSTLAGGDPYDAELRRSLEQAQARAEARARADEAERGRSRRSATEWLAEGDAARASGDGADALLRYLRAHEEDPDDLRPLLRIGSLHLTREPARAETIFRELAATPESPAIASLGLGLALLAQSRFADAEQALARAEAAAPRLAAAPAARGVALDRLGRPEEAQQSYLRAVALQPNDAMLLNNLGVSYLSTREHGRAGEVLRRAAGLAPHDRAVQNNLGLALAGLGRYDEALEAFLRAGGAQAAHNNLGTAHLLNGDPERAVAEYEQALLAPGDERLAVLRNLRAARRALHDELGTAAEMPSSAWDDGAGQFRN